MIASNQSENHEHLDVLTIAELFDPSEQYTIPIYQRNYAWGATEIEQLIQDVYDAALRNQASVSVGESPIDYFIGSLVVYLRGEGSFETIDGQQRHTTLSILLALLKNKGCIEQPLQRVEQSIQSKHKPESTDIALNLHFDSRPKSARTLTDLYNHQTSIEPEEPAIHSAYNIAARYLRKDTVDKEKIDISLFSDYLFKQVKILRVQVPQDTDLNHYFEIMNNRGEQLEKHEVLKARMMAQYIDDVDGQACFSAIWDACANMHRYVQLGFDTKVRDHIFGENWSSCPTSFEAVKAHFIDAKNTSDGMTLSNIISNKQYSTHEALEHEDFEKEERFSSVIDFPNFLLQVLSVSSGKDVALDDKRLLDTFGHTDGKLEIEPTVFIMQLLKCRMLFDKYIVKRDFDEKWSLLSLERYTNNNKKSFSYINTIGKDEDDSINNQLVMILSMFHVSYPTQVYKHWLSSALKSLLALATSNELNVSGDRYLAELELLSDRFFANATGIEQSMSVDSLLYVDKDNVEDEEGVAANQTLHTGTGVQNFIFNRLDYLLWQKLKSGYDFKSDDAQLDMNYVKERFDVFQFSFRTSVEHYFPQTNPLSKVTMKDVDRFGNLCLITPSSNSKLSNYLPENKKQYYAEKGRTESLKQAFMMSYKKWAPDEQGLNNIKSHEEMMIKVLCKQ